MPVTSRCALFGKDRHFGLIILSAMSRIFLGRLAFDARERDVEKFLRGFGRIREISLKKGYGFVVRFMCSYYRRRFSKINILVLNRGSFLLLNVFLRYLTSVGV